MLKTVTDGLIGLFMFFSHWFSPGTDVGEIKVMGFEEAGNKYRVAWTITVDLNEQMNNIIDAGIPLRFMIKASSDAGDTIVSIRTLWCDISQYTYAFSDSLKKSPRDSVYRSQDYAHIYKALKSYCAMTSDFSRDSRQFYLEAEILPSRVSQLGRTIEMSDICGVRKLSRQFIRK